MNAYARLFDALPDLNGAGVTGTTELSQVKRALAEASRAARTYTSRQFHPTVETVYLSGNGCRELWLDRDLISVTTLKVADEYDQPSTFENTLAAATDYTLWPRNASNDARPYRKIILNPNGQYAAFPRGVDNIQLVGKFGYADIQEAVVGAAAITGTVATTSGLTITASATVAALLHIGDQIVLGTEEMGPIVSAPTTSIIVEARGINGTTAQTHSGVAMYLRRYPDDVERAVRSDAARYLWRASQGFPEGGFREMWPAIAMTLQSYTDPGAVL